MNSKPNRISDKSFITELPTLCILYAKCLDYKKRDRQANRRILGSFGVRLHSFDFSLLSRLPVKPTIRNLCFKKHDLYLVCHSVYWGNMKYWAIRNWLNNVWAWNVISCVYDMIKEMKIFICWVLNEIKLIWKSPRSITIHWLISNFIIFHWVLHTKICVLLELYLQKKYSYMLLDTGNEMNFSTKMTSSITFYVKFNNVICISKCKSERDKYYITTIQSITYLFLNMLQKSSKY